MRHAFKKVNTVLASRKFKASFVETADCCVDAAEQQQSASVEMSRFRDRALLKQRSLANFRTYYYFDFNRLKFKTKISQSCQCSLGCRYARAFLIRR